MRGYNVNPILMLSSLKDARDAPQKRKVEPKEEQKSVQNADEKPPVVLAQYPTNANSAINPSTAWMFVSLLLLFLIILMVLDARSRVSRLEAILFHMLSQQQYQK